MPWTATPEILFVTAAGNDDNDVEFDVVIPSNFDLPNLMVVGAVDQAGEPTGFTSGGRNVRVYANGFEVESYVPGGETMKMSGTSMASPNVCNLAAKLFTLEPALTPAQVRELIEKGADPEPGRSGSPADQSAEIGGTDAVRTTVSSWPGRFGSRAFFCVRTSTMDGAGRTRIEGLFF